MITLIQEREFIESTATSLDVVIEWIKNNLNPEDVFDENDLIEWAEDNGFFQENDEEIIEEDIEDNWK